MGQETAAARASDGSLGRGPDCPTYNLPARRDREDEVTAGVWGQGGVGLKEPDSG